MACITLLATPMAMATTELARAVRDEATASWQTEGNAASHPLRLNWVVVTDTTSRQHLRMHWETAAEDC
jgi:hypothetical protein